MNIKTYSGKLVVWDRSALCVFTQRRLDFRQNVTCYYLVLYYAVIVFAYVRTFVCLFVY